MAVAVAVAVWTAVLTCVKVWFCVMVASSTFVSYFPDLLLLAIHLLVLVTTAETVKV